jgi:hypothetical protein
MTPFRSVSFFKALLLFVPIAGALAGSVGPCHPFPGAVAQDCLELIGTNLQTEDQTSCTGGRATITLRNCSITTTCGAGVKTVDNQEAVRRALTAIGSCALNDRGSISGTYTEDGGARTCYLYPGK